MVCDDGATVCALHPRARSGLSAWKTRRGTGTGHEKTEGKTGNTIWAIDRERKIGGRTWDEGRVGNERTKERTTTYALRL